MSPFFTLVVLLNNFKKKLKITRLSYQIKNSSVDD